MGIQVGNRYGSGGVFHFRVYIYIYIHTVHTHTCLLVNAVDVLLDREYRNHKYIFIYICFDHSFLFHGAKSRVVLIYLNNYKPSV